MIDRTARAFLHGPLVMRLAPVDLSFLAAPAGVLLTLLGLLLLQWPLRLLLRRLLGPLFALEMTRLARHGSTTAIRCAYAAALLVALYASFPAYGAADRRDVAKFAESFCELFLVVQSVTMIVLVPIYFSGAISDEKEKRSLDFLLTAQLSRREIILGKYAARALSLSGVLLAGLPVMALTMLWGGVDLLLVCCVFAATILSMLSLGAVSMLCSVLAPRTTQATAVSMSITVALTLCCFNSPFGPIANPIEYQRHLASRRNDAQLVAANAEALDILRGYSGAHLLVAAAALAASIIMLRRLAGPAPAPRTAPANERFNPLPVPAMTVPLTAWRPIHGHAIVWKERFVGRQTELFFDALWLYFGGIVVTIAIPAFFSGMEEVRRYMRPLYFGLLALLTFGLCVGLLLHLAGAVTREREHRTLESLLTLPDSRGRILLAKWQGALARRWRWFAAVAALLIIIWISGSNSVAALALLLLLVLSQAAFVASLSLLMSVLARSTVRASVTTLLALVAVAVATGIVVRNQQQRWFEESLLDRFHEALNPVTAWMVAYRLGDGGGQAWSADAAALLSASLTYLAVSAGLLGFAIWRFNRTERYA